MQVKWILERWIPESLLNDSLGQGECFSEILLRVQFCKPLHACLALNILVNIIKWVGLLIGPELDIRLFQSTGPWIGWLLPGLCNFSLSSL